MNIYWKVFNSKDSRTRIHFSFVITNTFTVFMTHFGGAVVFFPFFRFILRKWGLKNRCWLYILRLTLVSLYILFITRYPF